MADYESVESAISRAIKAGGDTGSKEVSELLRKLVNGEIDFASDRDPANSLVSSDLLFLVQNGLTKSLTLSQLTTYLASVLGTGTGGDPEVPPDLPVSVDVMVPVGRPDGAPIAYIAPALTPAPVADWTMTPVTGASIRADSGDVYLTDSVAFFAALASATTLTTTITASNTAGSDSAFVTFSAMQDYDELPVAYHDNLVFDWNLLDNRNITYDSTLNLVTRIEDNSLEDRYGHNSQDKVGYVLNSGFGAGKPAMRSAGTTGLTSGLFFNQNTIWRGVRIGFSVTTTENLFVSVDQMYKLGSHPDESALQQPTFALALGSITLKPVLVTLIADGDTMTCRVNGAEVTGSPLTLNSYNQPHYPIIAFLLFDLNSATGTLISAGAIMQGRSWKDSAINGDVCRITQYLNAVAA